MHTVRVPKCVVSHKGMSHRTGGTHVRHMLLPCTQCTPKSVPCHKACIQVQTKFTVGKPVQKSICTQWCTTWREPRHSSKNNAHSISKRVQGVRCLALAYTHTHTHILARAQAHTHTHSRNTHMHIMYRPWLHRGQAATTTGVSCTSLCGHGRPSHVCSKPSTDGCAGLMPGTWPGAECVVLAWRHGAESQQICSFHDVATQFLLATATQFLLGAVDAALLIQ